MAEGEANALGGGGGGGGGVVSSSVNVVERLDPETEFLLLCSKQERHNNTSNEWELFKENVRPLKRGRNVNLLNHALKSQTDIFFKKSLLAKRRKLIEEIDAYKGEDPLHPWLQCIKWVQESFPPGGDSSGLVVIYEQCVRTFWHDHRYKQDLRYLKVWLEYAENCIDAEVIFNFLDANKIGQTHSVYYISYALHMETKNKIKTANDIFNRGIARNAQPKDKLEAAFKKFVVRSMTRPKTNDDDSTENRLPVRSFGTVLTKGENRSLNTENSAIGRNKLKSNGVCATPLAIFKDKNANIALDHQPVLSKTDTAFWHSLGTQAQRNKENNAVASKWTSHKIPQRPVPRTGVTASACIEVFVDEECAESHKVGHSEGGKSSTLQLRVGDGEDLKKEMELLRENPLRNFPPNSLPR